MNAPTIPASDQLADVRYEIRGPLARRALELERSGYDVVKLNIGNPGAFGFRTPETMRLALIENLGQSDGYCASSKGIFQLAKRWSCSSRTVASWTSTMMTCGSATVSPS